MQVALTSAVLEKRKFYRLQNGQAVTHSFQVICQTAQVIPEAWLFQHLATAVVTWKPDMWTGFTAPVSMPVTLDKSFYTKQSVRFKCHYLTRTNDN